MRIEIMKSKIHRVKITQAELHYVGSIYKSDAATHTPVLCFPNNNLLTA
jgi:aspartate 1-decarboxylase